MIISGAIPETGRAAPFQVTIALAQRIGIKELN
jgi:hypothetical protein